MLGGCWFTTLVKDSRHAWRLLVNYLSEGFKACLEVADFLVKDSRLAWRLLVYYLSEGFKACLEVAGLLP